MLVILHERDCLALCQMKRMFRGQLVQFECSHNSHACTCSAPTAEQLRELVEAAEVALRMMWAKWMRRRLDAALKPWRIFFK